MSVTMPMSEDERRDIEQSARSLDRWSSEQAEAKRLQIAHDAAELPCRICGVKPALKISKLCAMCFPSTVRA